MPCLLYTAVFNDNLGSQKGDGQANVNLHPKLRDSFRFFHFSPFSGRCPWDCLAPAGGDFVLNFEERAEIKAVEEDTQIPKMSGLVQQSRHLGDPWRSMEIEETIQNKIPTWTQPILMKLMTCWAYKRPRFLGSMKCQPVHGLFWAFRL